MKVPEVNISIGNYIFDFVHSGEVQSSWKTLTDTAVLKFPANLKINKNELSSQIKKGDRVIIKTGYEGRLNTIFTGYVTGVKPTVPVAIMCEDEMWKLKQFTITDSSKKQQLVTLLSKHFGAYEIDALDVKLGDYLIENVSGAKLLDGLRKDFGLYAFFRNGVLVVGKPYEGSNAKEVRFRFGDNIAKNDLEYKHQDDVKIKVKAISNNSDGTKTEVELGDTEGESRTLNFYNVAEAELKNVAEREMLRYNFDGWRGRFTAFGEPFVQHGDVAILEDIEDSDKTGGYYVDAVNYTFGVDGNRQVIDPAMKI